MVKNTHTPDIPHNKQAAVIDQASIVLKEQVQEILDSKKATDVHCIDLAGKSDIADFMIIATGTSTTHVGALADYVVKLFKEHKINPLETEGMTQREWVLVDTPYVIVHLFKSEVRKHYNLEKMWDADFSEFEDVTRIH